MGQKNTDTAVLIFSLSARREAERKALFGKGKKKTNNEFFDILIGRTQKMAAATGVDTFFIDEGQQHGHTFGERYANAFQQLFDQGYTKVVSIGNDAPDLTAETLTKAIDEIQRKDLVVGPSTDGGIYLLALSSSLFDIQEFLALPWLQASLFETFSKSNYWQKGGSCSLDALSDIDDTTSLWQFAQSTSDRFLADFIRKNLFYSITIFANRKDRLLFDVNSSSLTVRGPPSTVALTERVLKTT